MVSAALNKAMMKKSAGPVQGHRRNGQWDFVAKTEATESLDAPRSRWSVEREEEYLAAERDYEQSGGSVPPDVYAKLFTMRRNRRAHSDDVARMYGARQWFTEDMRRELASLRQLRQSSELTQSQHDRISELHALAVRQSAIERLWVSPNANESVMSTVVSSSRMLAQTFNDLELDGGSLAASIEARRTEGGLVPADAYRDEARRHGLDDAIDWVHVDEDSGAIVCRDTGTLEWVPIDDCVLASWSECSDVTDVDDQDVFVEVANRHVVGEYPSIDDVMDDVRKDNAAGPLPHTRFYPGWPLAANTIFALMRDERQ